MEENNDFEKYDGHEESIETLLGTNEKSSSMTSRERVDDVLENEGADALSKFGVPKNLGKKAIKKDGGTFMPTHGPTQKMAKNYSRNKLAQGLDKIDNLKKGNKLGLNSKKNPTNSKNGDKTSNRINNAKNKRSIFANRRISSKGTDSEESESNQKQGSKQSIKDKVSSKITGKNKTSANTQGNVSTIVKQTISRLAKKVLLAAAPYIIGFILLIVLIFFVIELILGPLMEVWGHIDEAITGVANFSEKVTNFYNGFGFQDSKEAFYDELDDLCDRYGCSNDDTGLDVPLILATLFYTEGMGYDTAYDEVEALDAIDESMMEGVTPSGVFSSVRTYLKNKFDEAQQTVDENGLVYNAGKIYRLRKLARNQFHTDFFGTATREGEPKEMSIIEFLDTYAKNIGASLLQMLKDAASSTINMVKAPFKEFYAAIVGSDYSGSFYDNEGMATTEFAHSYAQLIGDIFYGVLDITKVDLKAGKIYYKTWKYDEENYKNYLMKYYFEYMPEFRNMIKGLSGEAREKRKEQLFNDIVSNKKLFEDIFLKYQNSSSENYVETCLGAINQTLVNNLNMPVDIAENFNITFDENYSYGVVNGKNHNGVDLNSTTAGVNLGSNVYSVANGKIVSIEDSKCGDKVCGKSIKISHDINVDNETFKFFTIYSNVDIKSELKVESTVVKGDTIGTINNSTDNTEGLHFTFMDANSDANGVVIDPTNLFIKCTTKSSGTLVGDTIQDRVWNFFAAKGYNKFKIAAIMANINNESAFKTNNLENACEQNYTDETITEAINSGKIGKSEFIASTNVCKYYTDKNGNYDGRYGYGLSQWTAQGRKERFYNMKVEYNVPIDDEGLQLDLLYAELEESWAYKTYENTWRNASSESDIASATTAYCHGFEIGSGCDARISVAQNFYNEYKNK